MIQGAEDDKDFVVKHYIEEEAKDIFKNFITSRFGNVWFISKERMCHDFIKNIHISKLYFCFCFLPYFGTASQNLWKWYIK